MKCKECGHDRFDHHYEDSWDGKIESVWIGSCKIKDCNCEWFEHE